MKPAILPIVGAYSPFVIAGFFFSGAVYLGPDRYAGYVAELTGVFYFGLGTSLLVFSTAFLEDEAHLRFWGPLVFVSHGLMVPLVVAAGESPFSSNLGISQMLLALGLIVGPVIGLVGTLWAFFRNTRRGPDADLHGLWEPALLATVGGSINVALWLPVASFSPIGLAFVPALLVVASSLPLYGRRWNQHLLGIFIILASVAVALPLILTMSELLRYPPPLYTMASTAGWFGTGLALIAGLELVRWRKSSA